MEYSMITHAELLAEVTYDPETGHFEWREVYYPRRSGPIGWRHVEGYICTKIRGRAYKLHRLAIFYMTGQWPPEQVDHINGDRSDNRFSNLRLASHGENRINAAVNRDNRLGVRGVRKTQRGLGYSARITKNGKQIHLGYFKTIEAAAEARRRAELELHGQFAPSR